MADSSRRVWPLAVLLAEVLVFFRHILFYGHYAIPWDFRYYHFSQAWFVAQSLARGQWPLWDPYTYCGFPFYANLTAQVFYPPALAAVLASNWTGGAHLLYWLELHLVAHVFLAGALAYWLLRRLQAGRGAALVGATIYQLGPYMASQTQHLGAIDAAAWLPLAWLSVISLADGFRRRWLVALAFALAMAVLSGFPAAAAVVLVTCFLLAAILVMLRRAPPRLLVFIAAGALWAVLLAAIQLFPTFELSRLSVARYRSQPLGSGGGMPLASLVSLVLPNHYGIFQFQAGAWKLPYELTFLYTYCGIPALIFAAIALVFRRNRYATAFGLLALCAALWMLGDSTPIGKTFFILLPNSLKAPLYAHTALCAFSLAMALLAGVGAQQFLAARARWLYVVVIAVVAADLLAVSSGRPFNTVDERRDAGITHDQVGGHPQIPAGIRRLTNQITPPWRVDGMQGFMDLVTHGPLFEYPSANGNDPLALLRFMQVRLLFCDGDFWGRYYEIAHPDSPVLKLLNVRYVIAAHPLPQPGRLAKVAELGGTLIYENPGVLPRFFLVNHVRQANDMQQALAILRSPDFDVRAEAVVEQPVHVEEGNPGSVRVVNYGAQQIILSVETPAPALLVTSETAYPGWRAWLDGHAQPLLATNVAFRGLRVPAGSHVIVMRFAPGILRWSAWLSLIAWLALASAFWLPFRSMRQLQPAYGILPARPSWARKGHP